jgi:four helix bundle protein
MQDFRNIDAWVKAHDLVLKVYQQAKELPREEVFGLTLQLRRSVTAIATRIAEGSGRTSDLEFASDLRRSAAHCNEFEYLVVLARDLGYWKPEVAEAHIAQTIEVRKMVNGLLRKL